MSTHDVFIDFDKHTAEALRNANRAIEVDIHDEGQTLPDWFASIDKTELSIFDADIEKLKCHQEQSFYTTRTVLHCLFIPKPKTTIEYDYPVVREFDGLATIDCIEFCNSHGLVETLRQCFKHTQCIFHNITRLFAELSFYQDDDTDDIGHIVIRLEVKSTKDVVRANKKAWLDWFIGNIGPEERMFFNLVVKRDSL